MLDEKSAPQDVWTANWAGSSAGAVPRSVRGWTE